MTLSILFALAKSQSLWVRDRFLMIPARFNWCSLPVAIPLGQGQVFNTDKIQHYLGSGWSQSLWVRDKFSMTDRPISIRHALSQSLWVRDRFLINFVSKRCDVSEVAIPLGQEQVFNTVVQALG